MISRESEAVSELAHRVVSSGGWIPAEMAFVQATSLAAEAGSEIIRFLLGIAPSCIVLYSQLEL
jgi:hypothetical protein